MAAATRYSEPATSISQPTALRRTCSVINAPPTANPVPMATLPSR